MHRSIHSAEIDDLLTKNISQLQKDEALDDEFFLSLSHDGKHLATGSYDKSAHVIDTGLTTNTKITCRHKMKSRAQVGKLRIYNK